MVRLLQTTLGIWQIKWEALIGEGSVLTGVCACAPAYTYRHVHKETALFRGRGQFPSHFRANDLSQKASELTIYHLCSIL